MLLDPGQPETVLDNKLELLGTKYVVLDGKNWSRLSSSPLEKMLVGFDREGGLDLGSGKLSRPLVWTSNEHRSRLIYTTGTTGHPKPVQMIASGLIRLADDPEYPGMITSEDRVGQTSNIGFDGALFDAWSALLKGATLVIIHKVNMLDPFAFVECLQRFKVTIMLITPAVLTTTAFTAPRAFTGMKAVIVGGEVLSRG